MATGDSCKCGSSIESIDCGDNRFLYAPNDVGEEVELQEDIEKSKKGRKRARNPDNWEKKHVKSLALGKTHLTLLSLVE